MTAPCILSIIAILLVCTAHFATAQESTNATALVDEERKRCGEILDMHLHPSNYSTVDPLLQQMDAAGISRAILYSVYAANNTNTFLPDANTQVEGMVQGSNGRMYGLASLDTSGGWNTTKEAELERLLTYLEMPDFVGTKLAPPHTCLPLNGTILPDIIQAVSMSSKPVVAIHTGTTPFCGVFGDIILGYRVRVMNQFITEANSAVSCMHHVFPLTLLPFL